ncbi:MAG: hypothetical protein KIS87_06285 [Phycisphaeraceae bacterium]|nr:hypothetical protein [Phycisphaeraceae bacterium]
MVWAVAIVLLVGGLGAVALGLRGRRVGDAPHCRECGFDLSGIVDRAGKCPECGRSLAEGRAVVAGARRRPRLAAAGAAAIVVGLAVGALAVSAANPSWNSVKPARLLLFEASRLRGPAADAAAAELAKRLRAGTLAPERLAGVIDACLAAQADPNVDWDTSAWMALLDDAFAAGVPSVRQTERYLRNVLSRVGWRLPERALAGYPIGLGRGVDVDVQHPVRRVPSRPVGFLATLERMTLNGAEVPLQERAIDGKWAGGWRWEEPNRSGRASVWTDFPVYSPSDWACVVGENELRATWRIRTVLGAPDAIRNQQRVTEESFDLSWTVETVHRFRGYETPKEMVRVVTGEEAAALTPELALDKCRMLAPSIVPRRDGLHGVDLSIGMQHLGWTAPVEARPWVVGRVEIRNGERTWPLRTEGWKPRHLADPRELHVALSPTYVFANSMYVDDLPLLDKVDVAIIPDLHWAARLGWVETLWGEEIVIRDVPVDWSWVAADLRPAPPAEPGGEEAEEDDARGAGGEGGR